MPECLCNRCGKELAIRPIPTIFELGFRKEEMVICPTCVVEVKENEKKLKDKYKKKLIKITNEYFGKIQR